MAVPAEQLQIPAAPTRDAGVLPAPQMAALLQITERRLQQLAKDGIAVAAERGAYRVVPSVQGYIRFLRDRHQSEGPDGELNDGRNLKARLLRAQTEKIETEVAEMQRRLVPAEDLDEALHTMVATARAMIQAIPAQATMALEGASTPEQRREILARIVEDILERLAAGEGLEPEQPESPAAEGGANG